MSKTKDMKNNPIFKNHIDYHYIEYMPDKLTVAEDEEGTLFYFRKNITWIYSIWKSIDNY